MPGSTYDQSRRRFLRQSSLLSVSAGITAKSIGALSLLNASTTIAAPLSDYKALVYVFLAGGNDAFNMLVPKGDGELRTSYENGRAKVALDKEDLHDINLVSAANVYGDTQYEDFGLHPECLDMANLFNAKELSFICNIGNLTTPITREQYLNKTVTVPPQLFSHSDQQRQFQSSPSGTFQFGWGGRMVELLDTYNSNSVVSPLMSVSGLNTWHLFVIAPWTGFSMLF
jgi:uncharacterized protein (DUF1501 family)